VRALNLGLYSLVGALAWFVASEAVRARGLPLVGDGGAADAAPPALPPPRAGVGYTQVSTFGTYLPEIVAAQDSVLYRWPARGATNPLRVWVQPAAPRVPGWSARLVQPARDAVLTWDAAGLPVRLALSPDSARADVRVTWESALEAPRIGAARTDTDADGWIVGATLRLAVRGPDGRLLSESTVRAAALHEVGHLLGLNHTADTTAIMAPRATGRDRLAPADLATATLLYRLAPGRVQ
jgi:hypothetical protein